MVYHLKAVFSMPSLFIQPPNMLLKSTIKKEEHVKSNTGISSSWIFSVHFQFNLYLFYLFLQITVTTSLKALMVNTLMLNDPKCWS